jgi:hypothetical protein
MEREAVKAAFSRTRQGALLYQLCFDNTRESMSARAIAGIVTTVPLNMKSGVQSSPIVQ